MKNFIANRLVIAAVSFCLGALVVWGAQRTSRSPQPAPEAQQLQPQQAQDPFDSVFNQRFEVNDANQFSVSEDDNFVYFEISPSDGELDNVDVQVDRGQVTISGEAKHKTEGSNAVSQFSSSFMRSFPEPPNVDAKKFELENKNGKVVVKFPKLKG